VGAIYLASGGYESLAESWNGTRWLVAPSPSPGYVNVLNGVSCASAATCTAAGFDHTTAQGVRTLIEARTATR
jgi:hypothetical protein